jgi:large conductance mechanosensitive channel
MSMLKEFKKFIIRGNVVDLAVAVAVGSAFTAVVNALVKDFLTPLIAYFQGNHDFAKASFHMGKAEFLYGDFINTFITFLITAAVVFFVVVQPLNHLMELSRRRQPAADPTTRKCPECLGEIPLQAKRCMFCTSMLKPQTKKN